LRGRKKGTKQSQEAIEQLRQKAIERWSKPGEREKQSTRMQAALNNPTTRGKLSQARILYWQNKKSKQTMRKPHGPLSPEHKAKIGASLRGKKRGPFSKEHSANMSVSQQRRREREGDKQ
jgi:hypothetical protein